MSASSRNLFNTIRDKIRWIIFTDDRRSSCVHNCWPWQYAQQLSVTEIESSVHFQVHKVSRFDYIRNQVRSTVYNNYSRYDDEISDKAFNKINPDKI